MNSSEDIQNSLSCGTEDVEVNPLAALFKMIWGCITYFWNSSAFEPFFILVSVIVCHVLDETEQAGIFFIALLIVSCERILMWYKYERNLFAFWWLIQKKAKNGDIDSTGKDVAHERISDRYAWKYILDILFYQLWLLFRILCFNQKAKLDFNDHIFPDEAWPSKSLSQKLTSLRDNQEKGWKEWIDLICSQLYFYFIELVYFVLSLTGKNIPIISIAILEIFAAKRNITPFWIYFLGIIPLCFLLNAFIFKIIAIYAVRHYADNPQENNVRNRDRIAEMYYAFPLQVYKEASTYESTNLIDWIPFSWFFKRSSKISGGYETSRLDKKIFVKVKSYEPELTIIFKIGNKVESRSV